MACQYNELTTYISGSRIIITDVNGSVGVNMIIIH